MKDVAARCAVLPNFVITWKRRYNENGIQGLRNQPRGNSKGVYGDAFRERLADKLNETPPEGCSRWTGPLLAQALGVDVRVVWRYLRRIHLTAEEAAGGAGHPEEQAETQAGPGAGETDSPERLDLKFVAKYMRKDGSTVVEQEFLLENAAPDFDDGNLWDRERFRREFATAEENLIRCSSTVASRLAADYMEGVAKKHSQGITPEQGR